MADPSPSVGLPNSEWIELRNVSMDTINLQNFRVADNSSQSGPMPYYKLPPDSLIIICGTGGGAALASFGPVISLTNFPSFDNSEDLVILKAPSGNTMHAVNYNSHWYRNELKKEGGWTLEMIDGNNACNGSSNWKASTNHAGGSPGKKNSVANTNPDLDEPMLERTYFNDDSSIMAVFNEPIDSNSGSTKTNFSMSNLIITGTYPVPPLFNIVKVSFGDTLAINKIYELGVANISDCRNNSISSTIKTKAGKPAAANERDIIINELLFNPRSSGEDYLEFYNRSQKIIDASMLHIANSNSVNVISNTRQLSVIPWLIFPGTFLVATADEVGLGREYLVSHPGWVLQVPSPPSMPDDDGHVLLLDHQGSIIDEVRYSHNWHFKLIDNEEGVALERIDPDGKTQDPSNWHSAASTSGYGTPTARNSQFKGIEDTESVISVSPGILSPDNDGRDDILSIQYKMTESGFMANITLFDINGRPVKLLVRNGLMGLEGYWNWNGLNDEGRPLPGGPYIVYSELFNLNGKVKKYKNLIFIARKL
jgi:hypothetical protein